jgi:hypothetical protein
MRKLVLLAGSKPLVKPMTDTYYDDARYSLTTRDMWLRKRNGVLELKWPAAGGSAQATPHVCISGHTGSAVDVAGIDFYHESTDAEQVAAVISRNTGIELTLRPAVPSAVAETRRTVRDSSSLTLLQALAASGVQPFGTIHSMRERYSLSVPVHGGTPHSTVECPIYVDIDTVTYEPPADGEPDGQERGQARLQYRLGEVELVQGWPVPHGLALPSSARVMGEAFRLLSISREVCRGKVLEYIARFRPGHYRALGKCGLLAAKLQ